jgi:hypothetical protein
MAAAPFPPELPRSRRVASRASSCGERASPIAIKTWLLGTIVNTDAGFAPIPDLPASLRDRKVRPIAHTSA